MPRIPSKYTIAIEVLSLAALVLLTSAALAETVKVEGGLFKGTVEAGLRVYRGIPYAAPPTGDLRWRPPQPPLKWDGVRAAAKFGRACTQTNTAIAPKDEALSEMMRTYWTNFARTGDPNGIGLPKWPAYDDASPQVLHIEAGSTKAGPLVNENGLKVLDKYFASRRADEMSRAFH